MSVNAVLNCLLGDGGEAFSVELFGIYHHGFCFG